MTNPTPPDAASMADSDGYQSHERGRTDLNDNNWRNDAYINERRFYYLGAYSGFGYVSLAVIFSILGGLFPPHDPTWTPVELQNFYIDNQSRITAGMLGAMVVIALYIPFYATVSKILEYKMKMPLLGRIQLYASIQAGMFVFLMYLCWAVALYRPERNPEITQAFNDWGWMMAWWTVNTTEIQFLAWGAAILFCKPANQLYPRWLGYLWLLAFFIQTFAWFIPALKTGPFAYNGALLFYVMAVGYLLSVLLSAHQTVKALRAYDEKLGLEKCSLFGTKRQTFSIEKNAS